MPKKKSIWKTLNVGIALVVFSIITGLLIFGAVFDFFEQWSINPFIASLVLLGGAVFSLIYLTWALLNWRFSRILK